MKGVFLEQLEIWTQPYDGKGSNWPEHTLRVGEYQSELNLVPSMEIQEMYFDLEKDRVLITDGNEVAVLNLEMLFLYKYKEKSQKGSKFDVKNNVGGQKMTQ